MISPFKKINLIFLVIIILPTIFFSIYEIGSVKKNEQVIETIYGNQLDAILYSVNQYAEDVISSWASKLNVWLNEKPENKEEIINIFTNENQSIHMIALYDNSINPVFISPDTTKTFQLKEISTILKSNSKILKRLKTYLTGSYRKIESFELKKENYQLLVFAIEIKRTYYFVNVILNSKKFINEVLDPKIQEIAQDKFYISAFYKSLNNNIYNSDKQHIQQNIEHKKAFWFLRNYYLGIELKNSTIKELVRARAKKNIYLIVAVDLVLLFGAWLIYRNIKKQMELAQIKSDFISNVSHEIRTPLALISMYIETLDLNRIKTEEKKKEYYSVIFQETQRLSGMVNKILNFSQIENGNKKYNFSETNVNDIVKAVVNTFKFHLENKEFEFQFECADELPLIKADKEALTDAVINLVDNAIKYSNENKFIKIITGKQPGSVFIEVEDHGIGISENDKKKIFDKFFRVTEKNLAYKTKGSGLGLAIVKHVVESHNGQITVKSTKNRGSNFKLIFPL